MTDLVNGQSVDATARAALNERSLLIDGIPNPLLINTFDAIANPYAGVRLEVAGPQFVHACGIYPGRSATAIAQVIGSPPADLEDSEVEVATTFSDHVPAFICQYAQLGPRPALQGEQTAVPFKPAIELSDAHPGLRASAALTIADALQGAQPASAEHLRSGHWRACYLNLVARPDISIGRAWIDTPAGVLYYADTRESGRLLRTKHEVLLEPSSGADVLIEIVNMWQGMAGTALTPPDLTLARDGRSGETLSESEGSHPDD
ncbi:hypothetical protein [Luteipulveratus mongoliensis]|uniref:Uncharacterized protein n=1 Tax=Luteipulveratus mongoliensis TaxID=571913 RepID=A0A0K1JMY8_9MICO|nr:hypothetical protein [Luteipulveratus mongoliensis]AKU18071.1 hypothetical protein VV02_23070 [Luteipulveratus mongoliensis]